MANNVTNIITFRELPIEKIRQIMESIKKDNEGLGSIDFNKIVPMPDTVFKGNLGAEERNIYGTNNWLDWSLENWNTKWNAYDSIPYSDACVMDKSLEEKPKATDSRIRNLIKNFADSGDQITYDEAKGVFYSEADFGEIELPDIADALVFHTAWSAPHPVLKQLSKDYPEALIEHQWYDEAMGFNVGVHEYINGEAAYEYIPCDGSKEAYELAAEIQGEDLEALGYVLSDDGLTYDYAEEDEEPQIVEEKIKVVLVKPMEKPKIVEIESGLKSMQLIVDGLIEEMMPFEEEVAIVCNEEGKIIGLDLNRSLKSPDGEIYDIIAGDFFICATKGENFVSLTDEQAQRYCEKFKNPERFYQLGDKIKSVQIIENKNKDHER